MGLQKAIVRLEVVSAALVAIVTSHTAVSPVAAGMDLADDALVAARSCGRWQAEAVLGFAVDAATLANPPGVHSLDTGSVVLVATVSSAGSDVAFAALKRPET